MKRNLNKQTTTILCVLLFGLGLLLALNTAAAGDRETGARIAADKNLQRQITRIKKIDRELARKIDKLPSAEIYEIGHTFPDGSIVFWVDDTGHHGLAAMPHHNKCPLGMDWYEAGEVADALGPGWRLPTGIELTLMSDTHVPAGFRSLYEGPQASEELTYCSWWSAHESDEVNAIMFMIDDNPHPASFITQLFWKNKLSKVAVRPVRQF